MPVHSIHPLLNLPSPVTLPLTLILLTKNARMYVFHSAVCLYTHTSSTHSKFISPPLLPSDTYSKPAQGSLAREIARLASPRLKHMALILVG